MSEDLKDLEKKRRPTDPLTFRDAGDALFFLRSLLADPFNIRTLRDALCEARFGLDVSALDDQEVIEHLAYVLVSGRLRIGRVDLPIAPVGLTSSGDLTAEPEEPRPVAPVVEDDLTWIAVQLVDMKGDPVRGEKYRVVGTDGTVLKEGNLDSNGEAKVSPVEEGTYKVTFPDLEESAWTLTSSGDLTAEPEEPRPVAPDDLTWIEVQLVDIEGDPVRGERYRVVGTDGTVLKEGTLDLNGEAKVSPVEEGTYKVTFPDLEESAWARLA